MPSLDLSSSSVCRHSQERSEGAGVCCIHPPPKKGGFSLRLLLSNLAHSANDLEGCARVWGLLAFPERRGELCFVSLKVCARKLHPWESETGLHRGGAAGGWDLFITSCIDAKSSERPCSVEQRRTLNGLKVSEQTFPPLSPPSPGSAHSSFYTDSVFTPFSSCR